MDCAFRCEEYPDVMMGLVDPNRRKKLYCGDRLPFSWLAEDYPVGLSSMRLPSVVLPLVRLPLVGLLFGVFGQPRILVAGQGWVQI